jgi:hypothetical protein
MIIHNAEALQMITVFVTIYYRTPSTNVLGIRSDVEFPGKLMKNISA